MRILVTGASRGIGKAFCLEALQQGFEVDAVVRKSEHSLKGCSNHLADVTDRKRMSELIRELAPQVDWFVINAGVGESLSPRQESSAELAAHVIDVNTTSAIYSAYAMAHEWIRLGLKGKRIAFVASLAAGRGLPRSGAYIASKTALVSFAQGFEYDLAKYGIHLSVILPGFIDTDMTRELKLRPFILKADEAARVMLKGLKRGQSRIAFPKPLIAIAWIRDHIPYRLLRWWVMSMQKKKVF